MIKQPKLYKELDKHTLYNIMGGYTIYPEIKIRYAKDNQIPLWQLIEAYATPHLLKLWGQPSVQELEELLEHHNLLYRYFDTIKNVIYIDFDILREFYNKHKERINFKEIPVYFYLPEYLNETNENNKIIFLRDVPLPLLYKEKEQLLKVYTESELKKLPYYILLKISYLFNIKELPHCKYYSILDIVTDYINLGIPFEETIFVQKYNSYQEIFYTPNIKYDCIYNNIPDINLSFTYDELLMIKPKSWEFAATIAQKSTTPLDIVIKILQLINDNNTTIHITNNLIKKYNAADLQTQKTFVNMIKDYKYFNFQIDITQIEIDEQLKNLLLLKSISIQKNKYITNLYQEIELKQILDILERM